MKIKYKLPEKFKDLEVISEYKGFRKPILVKDEFGVLETTPYKLRRIKKLGIFSAIDKTAYFKAKLSAVQPDLKVLGEYVGALTKILVRDKYGECMCFPNSLLLGKVPTIQTAVDKTAYFIAKAREVHGDKYDYSETRYEYSELYVVIKCPKHGKFKLEAKRHLSGAGCSKCVNGRGGDEFIRKAKSLYGELKFDFSKVVYVNLDTPVTIVEDGIPTKVVPRDFLKGGWN